MLVMLLLQDRPRGDNAEKGHTVQHGRWSPFCQLRIDGFSRKGLEVENVRGYGSGREMFGGDGGEVKYMSRSSRVLFLIGLLSYGTTSDDKSFSLNALWPCLSGNPWRQGKILNAGCSRMMRAGARMASAPGQMLEWRGPGRLWP